MEYFNKLFSQIDKLDDDFSVLNGRIIELGKSTDNEHLDFGLVNKYSDLLTGYIDFLNKEKEGLLGDIGEKSNKEFIAAKKLVNFRIDGLLKQLEKTLKQVSKIIKIKKKDLSEKQIKEIFKSSKQMEDIEILLKEFYIDLEIYEKVQDLIGINIDLDNDIEEEIENNNSKKDIIIKQKDFVGYSSYFLEKILDERNKRYNEVVKRKNNIFSTIGTENSYNDLFFNIFKKEYIIGLNIEDSDINNDNKKFIIFNENLDLLLNISDFSNNFDKILSDSKKHGLEKFILPFIEIKNILNKNILEKKKFNLVAMNLFLEEDNFKNLIKNIFEYFYTFNQFLNSYKNLLKVDFASVDYYYNSGFIELFKKDILGTGIIEKFINEFDLTILKKKFSNELDIANIKKYNSFFLEKQKYLMDFEKRVYDINSIIKSYTYPGKSLLVLKKDIKSIFKRNSEQFMIVNELIAFYNSAMDNNFRRTKSIYMAAQRSSSSYSGGSSWSSGGSSSSWSSSSSSGSSSYSSSGSSSW